MTRPGWPPKLPFVIDVTPGPPGVQTPAPGRGDMRIRPKLLWRLGLPALAAWVVHMNMNLIPAEGDEAGWEGWFLFALAVWGSLAAWRHLVIIDGPMIYQRGLTRWKTPLDIRQVNWVDLHRVFDKTGYYRVLEFGGGAQAWRRLYELRWWGGWRQIIRWLVHYGASADPLCEFVWKVGMPAKARLRLDRYAREFLSRPR